MNPNLHSRQIHLVSRPDGMPTLDNFELARVQVPEPADGEVVIANRYLSVDPYMRGRMNDTRSYVPPFSLGQPMDGGAVGEVLESRSPDVTVGEMVVHNLGWREFSVVPATHVQSCAGAHVQSCAAVDAPLSAFLGLLGMTGLTAYVGLLKIARMKPGEAVCVSGAAGAVGSAAGQIARIRGASQVIGAAGSDAKVQYLTETLGLDAAFNYRHRPVAEQLREAAPDGIDVYFDNVGGEHLEAALDALTVGGRVALCGAISQYNATARGPGPGNLGLAIGKRLTLQGFIVSDHSDQRDEYLNQAAGWLTEGSLRHHETVVPGIENAPRAFIDMLSGSNTGKMVVRVA